MGPPKASGARSAAPQASHPTAKTELKRAVQAGQRCRISPPQEGQAGGSSASFSSK